MCGGFIGDVLGSLTGGLIGKKQEAPSIVVEQQEIKTPEQLDLTGDNSAATALEAQYQERKKKGQQSTILTGMTAGTGSVGKKTLLGG